MAKQAKPGDAEAYRRQLVELLTNFEARLQSGDLRAQVLALVPASDLL